jgi:hypothetical protein
VNRPTLAARYASILGSALGIAAGLVELTIGPSIRGWVGNKQDTTRLGITTTLLGLIALAAALGLRRAVSAGQRLAIATSLLGPDLVGFTTVGRLWLLPGPLLIAAGTIVLAPLRKEPRQATLILGKHCASILTAFLAIEYVFLGATALGLAGALGILGGLVILSLLIAAPNIGSVGARIALIAATLPFAALTWWSIITPIIGILLLAVGVPVLGGRSKPSSAITGARHQGMS